MHHALLFAWGPTPAKPIDARLLGCEEVTVERKIASGHAFRIYVHATSVPELVAFVRARERDCSFRPFAETQALLIVEGA